MVSVNCDLVSENLSSRRQKNGDLGACVGGVWGGAPQVQLFVNYFNDFAISFGCGLLVREHFHCFGDE